MAPRQRPSIRLDGLTSVSPNPFRQAFVMGRRAGHERTGAVGFDEDMGGGNSRFSSSSHQVDHVDFMKPPAPCI
ncbi:MULTISPECIES: hypothetical protein [Corallococcus]|uniref:hypothetical protein n=1 Tax=Corallococcus TaxID=83461 RepID=UPI0011C3E099|nr:MULTISPECIES: hypothetical protein [Corallococcus]